MRINKFSYKLLIVIFLLLNLFLSCCNLFITTGIIGTGAAMCIKDSRNIGSQIEDKEIQIKALFKIKKDNRIRNSHVNVTVYKRHLLLTGETQSEYEKNIIESLCFKVKGIDHIINAIEIAPLSKIESRLSDIFISYKIYFLFLKNGDIFYNCKWNTERRIVYLMGYSYLDEESKVKCSNLIKNINFVKKLIIVY